MKAYRDYWYKLTIVFVLGLSFWTICWGDNVLSDIQRILMCSLIALFVHQFEEYIFPGGGPVVINYANFNERERFRNYPGNMKSSAIVNTLSQVIYLIAILCPQIIWLGIVTMFFNLFQLLGHGIKMNKGLKTWYNPGLASVIFLFVPISIWYFRYISIYNLANGFTWFLGIVAFLLLLLVTTILPVQILKDKNSPYSIPQEQINKLNDVLKISSLCKDNKIELN